MRHVQFKCYCDDGSCDICVGNLYAISLEQRLDFLAISLEQRLDTLAEELEDYVKTSDLENLIDDNLETKDFVSSEDLDEYIKENDATELVSDSIEQAVENFVDENRVEEIVEEKTTDLLEDSNIIKEAAAGATHAAMKMLMSYQAKITELENRIKDLENRNGFVYGNPLQ